MSDAPFLKLHEGHLSDHDLERYHLGMIADEKELAVLEEHYLACPLCAERAETSAAYVERIRSAIISAGFDLLMTPRQTRLPSRD